MFGGLARLFAMKTTELEAKLTGVAGFTGHGEVEIEHWSNGDIVLEVELRGVAGAGASVFVADQLAAEAPLENGRADMRVSARRDGLNIAADVGDSVEVRQHGVAILRGVLGYD